MLMKNRMEVLLKHSREHPSFYGRISPFQTVEDADGFCPPLENYWGSLPPTEPDSIFSANGKKDAMMQPCFRHNPPPLTLYKSLVFQLDSLNMQSNKSEDVC